MVDQVVLRITALFHNLAAMHPVCLGNRPHLLLAAGETDKTRTKVRNIGANDVLVISCRIQRDKHRHDTPCLLTQDVQRFGDMLQVDRTNGRAMCVSKIHQQVSAAKVPLGAYLAVLIDKLKRSAKKLFER